MKKKPKKKWKILFLYRFHRWLLIKEILNWLQNLLHLLFKWKFVESFYFVLFFFIWFLKRNFRKVKDLFWNYMQLMKLMRILKNLFIHHFYRKNIYLIWFNYLILFYNRTYKQCVESSLTQFKSGLNNRPGLGLLRSFLHTQTDLNDQQTNNSSINQTFFSV